MKKAFRIGEYLSLTTTTTNPNKQNKTRLKDTQNKLMVERIEGS